MIPTYNAARYLGDALGSILAQSVPPAQILVVDDASTDGTVGVAERFAAEGHPVRCIRLKTNGGPATARNTALRECDEPVVAFLDADDVWLPDHCRTLVTLLESYPQAALAYSETAPLGAHGSSMHAAGARQAVPGAARPLAALPALVFDSPIVQSAVVARRRDMLDAGGYLDGMRHAEDYDVWLRLALAGPFVASGLVTCLRRWHEGQATRQSARMYRGAWEARQRFFAVARARGTPVDTPEYASICKAAFERDLTWAWGSRDRGLVREVLALAPLVPGGEPVARAWRRRLRLLWPVWRAGVWVWDRQPAAVRDAVRRLRTSAGREAGIGPAAP